MFSEIYSINIYFNISPIETKEKMVAFNAKTFVIIADFRKQSTFLCTDWKKGIPVSFLPQSRIFLQSLIESPPLNGKCQLRMSVMKAGPVITDEGHMIFDVDFGEQIDSERIAQIDQCLHMIPGVIETGFFIGMCDCAYFGQKDGSVVKVCKKKKTNDSNMGNTKNENNNEQKNN